MCVDLYTIVLFRSCVSAKASINHSTQSRPRLNITVLELLFEDIFRNTYTHTPTAVCETVQYLIFLQSDAYQI